ncbi:hypothetical protein PR048_016127 [Dryococelus australis]|uniref:Uncharacterized protein n=1 Tax=Dryococelus australis TaxID=614101 RepID=A0ABQ9HJ10_9NEOP|nr:hypothetical protein PR048_016127 [Dryococelus australis]
MIDKENERIIRAETGHGNQPSEEQKRLFQRNNGNFFKLVEYIVKFYVVMTEHVRRVSSEETPVHYLSKNILNEFISFLSSKNTDQILN